MKDKNRRKALKTLSAAGAVGSLAVWQKPLISSVILPAHAQTSTTMLFSGTGLVDGGTITSLSPTHSFSLAKAVDGLIPPAHAQAGGNFYASVTVVGTSASVVVAGLNNSFPEGSTQAIRRGTLDTSGATGSIVAAGADLADCADSSPAEPRPASVTSLDDSQITISILTRCGSAEGSGCGAGEYLDLSIPLVGMLLPEPPLATSCGE